MKTLPEFLRDWCERNWNAKYVEREYVDMLDVMTGNNPNPCSFHREACDRVYAAYMAQK